MLQYTLCLAPHLSSCFRICLVFEWNNLNGRITTVGKSASRSILPLYILSHSSVSTDICRAKMMVLCVYVCVCVCALAFVCKPTSIYDCFFYGGGGFNCWGVCIWPISEFVAVKYSAKNISLTLQGAGLIPSSVCRPHYRLYGCSKNPNGQLPPVSQLHNCQTPNV